jgi:uncharacterized protein YicC (UPF0701 family)
MAKNNDSITKKDLDGLAQMVAKGFEETQKGFQKGFKGLDTKIETVRKDLTAEIGQVRKDLTAEIKKVGINVEHLQASVHRMQLDVGVIKTHLTVTERLERLEKAVFGRVTT